jgi:hypothetical protein
MLIRIICQGIRLSFWNGIQNGKNHSPPYKPQPQNITLSCTTPTIPNCSSMNSRMNSRKIAANFFMGKDKFKFARANYNITVSSKTACMPDCRSHPNSDNREYPGKFVAVSCRDEVLACRSTRDRNPHHGCDSGIS